MNVEKMSLEQAMQRLSEASINQNNRMMALETHLNELKNGLQAQNHTPTEQLSADLTTLETHMTERIETIHTQSLDWQSNTMAKLDEGKKQWNYLAEVVRDMRTDLQKITAALHTSLSNNPTSPASEEPLPTSYTYRETSTPNNTPHATQLSQEPYLEQPTTTRNLSSPYAPITPVVHTVVIPPSAAIPVFHGRISENPRQFLIRVKEYTQTVNNWNDTNLLHGISQFLRDSALEWYCQLRVTQRQPQSWTEFSVQFLTQFNSPLRRAKKEQEWRECHQRPNETINEFVVRLRTLWSEQKPHETEMDLIRHLRCKMRNDLLTMIGVSKGESLDEIITEAQKVEEILYQRSKYSQAPTTTYNDSEIRKSLLPTGTIYTNRNQNEVIRKRTNGARSYQYQSGYHQTQAKNSRSYKQIPNDTECFTCGQNGHRSWQCPNRYEKELPAETWQYSKNDDGTYGTREPIVPQ